MLLAHSSTISGVSTIQRKNAFIDSLTLSNSGMAGSENLVAYIAFEVDYAAFCFGVRFAHALGRLGPRAVPLAALSRRPGIREDRCAYRCA